MSSVFGWLPFTKEQLDVIKKVFGAMNPIAPLTGGGALGSGGPAPALLYGMLAPADKPTNIQLRYGMTVPMQPLGDVKSGPPGVVLKYGMPPVSPNRSDGVRLMLTDKQKADLQRQGIKPCDFQDVAKPMLRYGIIFPLHGKP